MFLFAYYVASAALCSLAAFLLTRRYYLAELRHLRIENSLDQLALIRRQRFFIDWLNLAWQARFLSLVKDKQPAQ